MTDLIITELKAYIENQPHLQYKGNINVAYMEFDYNSHALFSKLKDRGKLLSQGDKDCSKFEKDIDKFMHENNKTLTRPKTAMVTFEYSSAVNIIMSM